MNSTLHTAWTLLGRIVLILLAAGIVVGAAMTVEHYVGDDAAMPPRPDFVMESGTDGGIVSAVDVSPELASSSEDTVTTVDASAMESADNATDGVDTTALSTAGAADAGTVDGRTQPPDGGQGGGLLSAGSLWLEVGMTVAKIAGIIAAIATVDWLITRRKSLLARLRPHKPLAAH